MKNTFLLSAICLLYSCSGAGTLTQSIGGKTLEFSRKVYPLPDGQLATVEHRVTKAFVLDDSVVTNTQGKVLFTPARTEERDMITITDTYYTKQQKKYVKR